jgi:myosin heavy subunit
MATTATVTATENTEEGDPWTNANIWVMTTPPDGLWRPGFVKSHEPLDLKNKMKVFEIVLLNDTDLTEETITISTISIDKFNLEYQWVKKRDPTPENSRGITDMTSLAFLNEPEMLECMKQRFLNKSIYTNTGPILMAINPFESLNIYSSATLMSYYDASDISQARQLGPHVFQISNFAYRKMLGDKFDISQRENQAILVNGESGAGKTESTKQVLHYLGATSTLVLQELGLNSLCTVDYESLILASNPITESFGNAKTSRNNNSSRFGKFIELNYSLDGYIEGAEIKTYLLETVRVISQLKGERNYHIFYELASGLSTELKSRWGLTELAEFNYTNQSGEYHRHDNESDEENFIKLERAMTRMGISATHQHSAYALVVAVLHIGNIVFESHLSASGEETVQFHPDCQRHVTFVCELLCITQEDLLVALSKRTVEITGNLITRFLNFGDANAARENLSKTLYDLLFKAILKHINYPLSPPLAPTPDQESTFIGVLDIFGFEFFKHNSFEQLCINYANEKLQDHFNFSIFRSEQEVYKAEGLQWSFVSYPDNAERLTLFEHHNTGLFAICTELLRLPKPTDLKLVQTYYTKCTQASVYFQATKGEQGRGEFTVLHFACEVKYNCQGFVEKNRNDIAREILLTLKHSTNEFISSLHPPLPDTAPPTNPNTTTPAVHPKRGAAIGKKLTTVSSQFMRELTDLITRIKTTRSHFIRCIKPNNDLTPSVFNDQMVMSQLRCGGALGAVQVFRAGFPNRVQFELFVKKYSLFALVVGVNNFTRSLHVTLKETRQYCTDQLYRLCAAKLIDVVCLTDAIITQVNGGGGTSAKSTAVVNVFDGLQMGHSTVFMRAQTYEYLETLKTRAYDLIVRNLQRHYRAVRSTNSRQQLSMAIMFFSNHRKNLMRLRVSSQILLQRRMRVFLLRVKYLKTRAMLKIRRVYVAHRLREVIRCRGEERKRRVLELELQRNRAEEDRVRELERVRNEAIAAQEAVKRAEQEERERQEFEKRRVEFEERAKERAVEENKELRRRVEELERTVEEMRNSVPPPAPPAPAVPEVAMMEVEEYAKKISALEEEMALFSQTVQAAVQAFQQKLQQMK